ncbi:MAG TPA: alpha/beta hydrolase, partial [Burkholderiaceae bacterium]
DRDMMTPKKAAQPLMAAVANGRTVTVAASGHQMMAEQPDAVLQALRDFSNDLKMEGQAA